MDRPKILIADGSEDFRIALADMLQGAFHVRTCGEGPEALKMLQSYRPGILVLDLMLPGLDGISLLEQAAEAGVLPMVLAATSFLNEYVQDSMQRLHVSYVMMKPCDIKATVARILDLAQRLKSPAVARPEPMVLVSNMLLELGVPTNLNGYRQLQLAVPIFTRDRAQLITKELYPAVAALYGENTSPDQVERSIRSAICAAWKKRKDPVWQKYFPPDASGQISRPSNATFISRLADFLILEQLAEQSETV